MYNKCVGGVSKPPKGVRGGGARTFLSTSSEFRAARLDSWLCLSATGGVGCHTSAAWYFSAHPSFWGLSWLLFGLFVGDIHM